MRFNQIPQSKLTTLRAAIGAVLLVGSVTANADCVGPGHSCDPIVVEATISDYWIPPSDPNPLDASGFYDYDPSNDASGFGDPITGDPQMQVCDWIREHKPQGCNQPTPMPQTGFFPSFDSYAPNYGSALQRMMAYALTTTNYSRQSSVHGALDFHTFQIANSTLPPHQANIALFEDMAYICLGEQNEATQATQFSGGAGNTDANRLCQESLAAIWGEATGNTTGWWTYANMLLSAAGINVSFSYSYGPATATWQPTSFNSLQFKEQQVQSQAACALYHQELQRNDC